MIDVELLRQETLTGIIRDFQPTGLRLQENNVLQRQEEAGATVVWDIEKTARDLGDFQGAHSPAQPEKMEVIGQRSAQLARTFRTRRIKGSILRDLRRPGSMERERIAQARVGRELLAMTRKIDRQNEFMIASALQGTLDMTIDKVAHSVDYGFPASHLPVVGGATIPLEWDDPAANITEDIEKIQQLIEEDSGFTPRMVICSREVIGSLIRNDFVQSYFASTPQGVEALTRGTIGEFFGLRWIAYNGTFKDSAGVVTRYIPRKQAIFLPESDLEWGRFQVGSDVIPSDDRSQMNEVIGRYSYSKVDDDPAALVLFGGEVRLPIITNPNAIVSAEVLA